MSDLPRRQLAVGIIGLGRSGWHIHAAGLAGLPQRFRVVAVADPLSARRREASNRFGCTAYAHPQTLIDDDRVEVVVVATPSHTHVPLAQDALQAGKHVVVEKPVARSVEELDQLDAAARAARRVLTVFQNQRLDPSFLVIRSIIDSGRIGEVVLIRRTAHRFVRRSDWQTLRCMGGGELPNTALHFIDQLLTLVADVPIDMLADLRHTASAGDAEDHVKVTLRPRTGPLIDVECSTTAACPQDAWFVIATAGGITGTTSELVVRSTDAAVLPALKADPAAARDRKYPAADDLRWEEETIQVPPNTATRDYYRNLHDSICNGAELLVTAASVRRILDLIVRARAQTGFV